MPKACIIIPVWNSSDTIEQCVESVKMQTESDIECIVVDDGSEDDTISKAVNSISGDGRFKIIQQQHCGLSAARNAGIDASTADIIFHLDSDDLAKPEMVEHAIKFLSENNLDIVFFNAEVVNCGRSPVLFELEREHFKRKKHYDIMTGREFLESMIDNDDWVYASFIQASKKSKISRKFVPGIRAQDEICTIENLLLSKKVGHLDEVLYTRQSFPSSVSRKRKDLHYAWSRMKSFQELIKFVDEEHIENPKMLRPFLKKWVNQIGEGLFRLQQEDFELFETFSFSDKTMLSLFKHGGKINFIGDQIHVR